MAQTAAFVVSLGVVRSFPWRVLAAFLIIASLRSGPVACAQAGSLPEGFADVLVAGGLVSPVGVVWDGNGRGYLWEKAGKVWLLENGVKLPTPLIDISEEVGGWRDHGLIGFALDPAFLQNGRIYLMYLVDRHHLLHHGTAAYNPLADAYFDASIIRITRYTATGPAFTSVDPASRFVLLGGTPSTGPVNLHESHSCGSLVFGTDGTLLAAIGDGASYGSLDIGSAQETYWAQALADGMMRPEENVGAFRAQMVNSFSGKILRIDPTTGDGVPSNPWFDPGAPKAPRSCVWAMGLRNPYRMFLKPGSGSSDPAAGDPGTLIIGDVGWTQWEEINVCSEGGMNFGWPLFEGMDPHPAYTDSEVLNRDAPNPLFQLGGCIQQFLAFTDLLKQETPIHLNAHPNPCDATQQIPNSIPKHFHRRPAIDWLHGNRSRCSGWNGTQPVHFDLDDPLSPVAGPRFGGTAVIGGTWMPGENMPFGYQNSSFFSDYTGGWIKRVMFGEDDGAVSVHHFAGGLGSVVWLGAGPDGCLWYIDYDFERLRRICYTLAVDLPPVPVATQSVQYGPGPLSVQFTGSGSSDPEGGALTYLWNFGDGTTSTAPDPVHVFNAPPGVPTAFTVSLTVTDGGQQSASTQLLVSVNNTPPQVAITSFPNMAWYPVGVDTVFTLEAAVFDAEHGPSQLSYAWRTVLHHNTHTHPEPIDPNVVTSTVISGVGCDGETYFYRVTLRVTDAAGLSTTVSHDIHPRCQAIAPTAVIIVNTSFGDAPLTVHFDGSASHDPGAIVAYLWNFGDGSTSTASSVTKVFTDKGPYQVTLQVTDDDGLTGLATRVVTVLDDAPPQCMGAAGSITREFFAGISGITVADLVHAPAFPDNPTSVNHPTSFQGPVNVANNYGTRFRGWIVPPVTGEYRFIAVSDDHSAVLLSPSADPLYKQWICGVPGWTNTEQFDKYTQQTSAVMTLTAGRYYYVEMLHKEGSGNDHVALWWITPQQTEPTVVPGSALVRWADCPTGLSVRVALQGALGTGGQMRDDLRAAGLLPSSEPYSELGFERAGTGGESVTAPQLAAMGKNSAVDWVLVELRDKNNPAQVVATRAALLERDGDVRGVDGYGRINFNVPAGDYHVAVRHRNHLGVRTLQPVLLNAQHTVVDFNRFDTGVYGSEAQYTVPGVGRALWAGNVVRDNKLMYTGNSNDRDALLQAIGGMVPTATVAGYRSEDVNLDGVVRYTGIGNDRDPILQNIGGVVPTAVRFEQLP
jgi:PKD repeat protein/glucose/arabinose dehydrogenase